MTHPGTPRDIDLPGWLDGISFKPANTELKQVAHELARQLVALLGTHLHQLLPPGRDKSIVFTALEEEVLMRANRALAIGGGPREGLALESLQAVLEVTREIAAQIGAVLPTDPRIDAYKAEQRGEPASHAMQAARMAYGIAAPRMDGWTEEMADSYLNAVNEEVGRHFPGSGWQPITGGGTPERPFSRLKHSVGDEADTVGTFTLEVRPGARDALIRVDQVNEGENVHDRAEQCVTDPDTLAEYGAAFFAAAARLREAQQAPVG